MNTYIVDTTLRDGEQAPGVIFTNKEKFEIAHLLDKLGIEEVELGTPAMGKHEISLMRDIAMAGFSFKTISWCRALKADIDSAALCKTNSVSISFPVSQVQLNTLNKNFDWVKAEIPNMIEYAKSHFNHVIIGLQDASRCERKYLIEAIEIASNSGADRIRIADTVGILTPVDVMSLFADLKYEFPCTDFEFHAHNDLGMATANAFMALKYGAKGVSGTINGLGERAGNMAIEELIMTNFLKDKNTSKYNTQLINQLCTLVAEASKSPLHNNKPICGANVFAHETGVHVSSVLRNKLSYQPYDESVVGVKSNKIVIGKHSGKAALTYFFNQKGENPTCIQLKQLHEKIIDGISLKGNTPTEQFILNLYNDLKFSPANS